MAKNDIMATFRLPGEVWEAFKNLCQENKTSASQAIKDYIEGALKDEGIYPPGLDNSGTGIDKAVIEDIQNRLDRLEKMTQKHGGKINTLEMKVGSKKNQQIHQTRPPKKIDLSNIKVG